MSQEYPVFMALAATRGDPRAGLCGGAARLARAVARLQVRHRPASAASAGPEEGVCEGPWDGFSIQTCQREIHIALLATANAKLPGDTRDRYCRYEDAEVHHGAAAYRLLLEVAAGLKSAIPGETNVFGQVREAWRLHGQRQPGEARRALSPIMEALFRDVREIRARHLQGIGGQSYATLTRRLLAPGADAHVLIVGYGELGRSMPQKFSRAELGVFNRTLPGALPGAGVRSFSCGDERQAADWATHVVMCVPREPGIDARWIAALRGREGVRVAHLGVRRDSRGAWSEIPGLIDLDDLFDLQRAQAELRTGQLDGARAACAELAARAVSGVLI